MLFLFLWLVKWSKCLLQCLWFQTSVLTWCFCYRVNLPGDAHTEPVLVPPKARRSRAFCASADMKNCRIVQLHRTTFFFFFSKTTWPPTRKPQSTSFLFLRWMTSAKPSNRNYSKTREMWKTLTAPAQAKWTSVWANDSFSLSDTIASVFLINMWLSQNFFFFPPKNNKLPNRRQLDLGTVLHSTCHNEYEVDLQNTKQRPCDSRPCMQVFIQKPCLCASCPTSEENSLWMFPTGH